MLSFSRKESILRKRGVAVAPFPVRSRPYQERFYETGRPLPQVEADADRELRIAVAKWRMHIEEIYEEFVRASLARGTVPTSCVSKAR